MRGRRPSGLTLAASAIAAFLVAPTVIMALMSLSPSTGLAFPPPGLSVRWYQTFFASRMSVEVRIPFARQIASDLNVVNSGTEFGLPLFDYATQFGNVAVIPKFLVFQTPALAVVVPIGLPLSSRAIVAFGGRLASLTVPVIV